MSNHLTEVNNTDAPAELSGSNSRIPTVIRAVAVVAIIGAIIALMAAGTPSTKSSDDIWDTATVQGDPAAKHHFIMYTDLMCPYCDYFSRAVMAAQSDFDQYLRDHDIAFELRVTDFLYEYNGVSIYSQQSAEAVYCARREGKFWDYYHAALTALDRDYHSKGIGNAKGAPMITDITDDYWLSIGHELGLGDSFDTCYKNHETLSEVQKNTEATAKDLTKNSQGGLPFFKFGNFITTGFDPSWDWKYVKMYLDQGLKSA